jgi:hypothetical protein
MGFQELMELNYKWVGFRKKTYRETMVFTTIFGVVQLPRIFF